MHIYTYIYNFLRPIFSNNFILRMEIYKEESCALKCTICLFPEFIWIVEYVFRGIILSYFVSSFSYWKFAYFPVYLGGHFLFALERILFTKVVLYCLEISILSSILRILTTNVLL